MIHSLLAFELGRLRTREAGASKAREAGASKACEAGASKAREAGGRRAREASDSIKPGAQAPGSRVRKSIQPVKRAAALCVTAVARSAGSTAFFALDPGACAPGFMLSLASRALLTPASQAQK